MRPDRYEVAKQFGRNLRQARQWEGLTQRELGQRLAMNHGHLSQLENGWLCPRLLTVITLARALDVRVGDLLDGVE